MAAGPAVANPVAWADGKGSKRREYLGGPVLAATRVGLPHLSPGVPAGAWVGVFCNGGTQENTTGWIKGDAGERAAAVANRRTPIRLGDEVYTAGGSTWSNTGFHELGVGGVEGGSARGVTQAPGSPWATGAVNADVRRALSRDAVTAPGSWMGPRGIPDQVVLSMWCNRRHGVQASKRLGAAGFALNAAGDAPAAWSQWSFFLCTMAWSAGDAGAVTHVLPFVGELARVSEAERASRWTELAVEAGRQEGAKHRNRAYSAGRTWQKILAGEKASAESGDAAAAPFFRFTGRDRAATFSALVSLSTGGGSSSGASGSSSGRGSSGASGSSSGGSSSGGRALVGRLVSWRNAGLLAGALVIGGGAVVGGRALVRRYAADGSELSEVL